MAHFGRVLMATIVLLAFVAPAAADGKRIETEEEFREHIVDREYAGEERRLQYTGDGKLIGVSRGRPVKGTWRWAGDTLCRTATWGSKDLEYDCQAILVIGELLVIVRDRGRGRAFALRRGPLEVACFC